MAVAGLVLGSIALLLSWVPLMGWLVWLTGIAGLVLGIIKACNCEEQERIGFSVAAIVVSILAIVSKIYSLMVLFSFFE